MHDTIFLKMTRFLSLSDLVYNLKLSDSQFPQSFSSAFEYWSGCEAKRLGIAARKEWPVILRFSSQKSFSSSESTFFVVNLVRFFSDLKEKTGLAAPKEPSLMASFLSMTSAATGHFFYHPVGDRCPTICLWSLWSSCKVSLSEFRYH